MITVADHTIKISMSLARRLLALTAPPSDDYFLLKTWIETGEREEKRRVVLADKAAAFRKQQEEARLREPLSSRGTEDECGDEFNRCRRLYNFQWQHQCDLTSVGGLMIFAYNGQWVGTSRDQTARHCLEIVEHGIANGMFGEPFVGPLYEYTDEDEE